MIGEHPPRNSKVRCCWPGLHGPLLVFARRRSFSTTLPPALIGRAVWTDDRGDQVFSELKGNGTSTGSQFVGTFIGGTGRYAGATGSYEFSWRFVLETEDGTVQGQSMGLNGTIRVGSRASRAGCRGPAMKISPGLLIRRALPFAAGTRDLVHACSGGAYCPSLAPFRCVCGRDRGRAGRCISAC